MTGYYEFETIPWTTEVGFEVAMPEAEIPDPMMSPEFEFGHRQRMQTRHPRQVRRYPRHPMRRLAVRTAVPSPWFVSPFSDNEPTSGGIEGRSGSEYVRWIQSSLNRLLGLRLPLSGVMTVATRSALRSFQRQRSIAPDGIVGPNTEAALLRQSGRGAPTNALAANGVPLIGNSTRAANASAMDDTADSGASPQGPDEEFLFDELELRSDAPGSRPIEAEFEPYTPRPRQSNCGCLRSTQRRGCGCKACQDKHHPSPYRSGP